MLKKILTVLGALLVLFLFVVAIQPSEFQVTRSMTISAAPNTVFAQVNGLRSWNTWSPWAKLDPNAKNSFEGPKTGKGAVMSWSGNNEVGEGRMTIIDSTANKEVKFQLDFVRPMKATNYSDFTFVPVGKKTLVVWKMSGKNNFVAKAIGLVMDYEKMVGGQFEQGLTNLKNLVEKKANK